MKILFSATVHEFSLRKKNYFLIRDYLVEQGHTITHDWLNQYRDPKNDPTKKKFPANEYVKILQGLEEADALIFEVTFPTLSSGHLITLGMQRKIPTLVFWNDSSSLNLRRGFVESLKSDYVEIKSYNENNYKEVLNEFLNKYNNLDEKYRFNLVVDNSMRQYLEWMNINTFKTRTKHIKELIRKDMDNNPDYQHFLQHPKKK